MILELFPNLDDSMILWPEDATRPCERLWVWWHSFLGVSGWFWPVQREADWGPSGCGALGAFPQPKRTPQHSWNPKRWDEASRNSGWKPSGWGRKAEVCGEICAGAQGLGSSGATCSEPRGKPGPGRAALGCVFLGVQDL